MNDTTTILLTGSDGMLPALAPALERLGHTVRHEPLLRYDPPADWSVVDASLRDLGRAGALAVSSPRAARAYVRRARTLGVTAPPALPVWVVGEATAAGLEGWAEARWPSPVEAGKQGGARALAAAMLAASVQGPVFYPCGDRRLDVLPAALADAGLAVREVICYCTRELPADQVRLALHGAGIVVASSPSVARMLAAAHDAERRAALVVIGPATAAAAEAAGWIPAARARTPTSAGVLAAIRSVHP